jgi:hypothetical protein
MIVKNVLFTIVLKIMLKLCNVVVCTFFHRSISLDVTFCFGVHIEYS